MRRTISGGRVVGAEEGATEGDTTEDEATGDDTRADGGRDGTDVRWVMTPHDRTRRATQSSDRTTSDQLDVTRRHLAYCG